MRQIGPDLLSKLNQSEQTAANNADPKMSIQVSRARTTVMDSSYWTVETIREKPGIGDISLAARRLKNYGRPDRLYEIHVDNGIVKTTIREYPDLQKVGWQPQFELGAGSAVAIAFDGEWELWRKRWRLKTTEKPWIFWVDASGVLWAQLWDEVDTKVQLATGVSKVKAMRGWKNKYYPERDQGIVVGYIKADGFLYYRNYCQDIDGVQSWEMERKVDDVAFQVVNLNMWLTNDYRMGFVLENAIGEIYWLITERNWAGMAIAPEYIKASVGGSIELIVIEKKCTFNTEYISASAGGAIEHLYAMSDNAFRSAENFSIEMLDEEEQPYQNWGFGIRIRTAHDMTSLDYLDFMLKDSNDVSFVITCITKENEKIYSLSSADFNNAFGDLTLSFIGGGTTRGEAGQVIDPFSITFNPQNLVPTFIPLPEVEVIWNE
jgi:hypothetical protein